MSFYLQPSQVVQRLIRSIGTAKRVEMPPYLERCSSLAVAYQLVQSVPAYRFASFAGGLERGYDSQFGGEKRREVPGVKRSAECLADKPFYLNNRPPVRMASKVDP